MLPVAHVGQVARQCVFAHVASVAVVVGLAEAEQVAIVAGVPLIIVDRQLLQRLRGAAGRGVFACYFADGRVCFRHEQADGDARHHGDHQQNQYAFHRPVGIEQLLTKMRAVTRSVPCHRTLSSLTRT